MTKLTKENIVTVYRGAHIWAYEENKLMAWKVLGSRYFFKTLDYAKEYVDKIVNGEFPNVAIRPNGSLGKVA